MIEYMGLTVSISMFLICGIASLIFLYKDGRYNHSNNEHNSGLIACGCICAAFSLIFWITTITFYVSLVN